MSLCKIPDELKVLNSVEQRLICQVHAYLKLVILPYGQSAMNGQCINFPFDISEMLQKPSSPDNFIIIKTSSPNTTAIPKEYIANMNKVKDAMLWLNVNNPLYANVKLTDSIHDPSQISIINMACDMKDSSTAPEPETAGLGETSVIADYPCMPSINLAHFIASKENTTNIPSYPLKVNSDKPLNLFSENNIEQLAFPIIFPNGKNGLFMPRRYSLTHLAYFQNRLMCADNRFSSHLPYLFWSTNVTEKQIMSTNISIAMKMRPSTTNKRSTPLNAGTVRKDIKSNPDFPENYYGFMRSIRGSPAYWNTAKLDLFAMIKDLGPPTWFLTLSANDMNWKDLLSVLCKVEGLPTSEDYIESLPKSQKIKLMNSNPITTARHFCKRLHHFIHKVILSDVQPIGPVRNYFYRIEFQARGSPHIHSIFWIDGAPDLDTVEGRRDAPQFIDNFISTYIPPAGENDDLRKKVTSLQTHNHTSTCQRYVNNELKCRFNFPHQVSPSTVLKAGAEIRNCRKCYTIKRQKGSEHINEYNHVLLQHWGANMDIQFIGSVFGAASYVCSYICKKEADSLKYKTDGSAKKFAPISKYKIKINENWKCIFNSSSA